MATVIGYTNTSWTLVAAGVQTAEDYDGQRSDICSLTGSRYKSHEVCTCAEPLVDIHRAGSKGATENRKHGSMVAEEYLHCGLLECKV